ncbi:hypothetical protein [Ktedonobacter sp. SOSP1-85]|uniref:hypothetical protein n=1 Tax=Ktedonobacter sp. SOSP1-85 TaxID=2778367 RepID=UPI00191697AF|nr:hypothetical protein [Ktedonobacter sp. SOSP1-85]
MKRTRFDALANAPTSRRKVLQVLATLAGTSCLEGLQIAGLDDSAMAVLRDGEPGEWATGGPS